MAVLEEKTKEELEQMTGMQREVYRIEKEAMTRGYMKLSAQESNKLSERIKRLVKFVQTDGVQDVIIRENKPVVVKTRGIMSNNHVLDEWNEDTFNYFVWEISNQAVDRDMDIRKDLTQARIIARNKDNNISNYHGWLNRNVVRDLLEDNEMSFDYSVSVGDKTLRIHILYTYAPQSPDRKDITMAIRVNDTKIPLWNDLNIPDRFKDVTKLNSGLVLISGHVGSGKTTTAASALNNLNLTSDRELMVLTIENPVEYVYKSETITFLQRNVGNNTPSFGKATDDAMRENADIVLIGELRTAEEMDNALRLAEIGKLVIATIHSNSVADTPERIINSFPGDVQANVRSRLMENVVCIMHQNLERVGDVQFPVVEGFLVSNSDDQIIVREALESRAKLVGFMQKAEQSWVITHNDAFEELVKGNAFEDLLEDSKIDDIEEARKKLVPGY